MRGPIVVTAERIVTISPPALWARQAAVQEWTTWHPDVSWVAPTSALAVGSDFEWVWRGTRARSRVTACRDNALLAWATETASGNSTMHWSFHGDGDKTIVGVRAKLEATHVLARRPKAARAGLERSLVRWLDALTAVETDYATATPLD